MPGSSASGPATSPTNSPVTLSAWAVNVSRWQAGLSTWFSGALTTGVLRTMTSRSPPTRSISSPRSTALGACFGTVDSSTVRGPVRPAAALHGMVMFRSVATYPISGAFDAGHHAVLRPVELGGGLGDRQQRSGDGEQGAEQAGDDGDEARGPVVGTRVGHGARC